jgi:hypothetical protein
MEIRACVAPSFPFVVGGEEKCCPFLDGDLGMRGALFSLCCWGRREVLPLPGWRSGHAWRPLFPLLLGEKRSIASSWMEKLDSHAIFDIDR